MAEYTVTITEAPAVSSDATLSSLMYGGSSVPNFSPTTYSYDIELPYGIKSPPTISATPNESHAQVEITQAGSVPGTGYVDVTAQDGTTTLRYTVNYTVPAPPTPQTDLTLHVPEVFEAPEIAGGYGGTITEFGGHEYEVYYINRDAESNLSVSITNADKAGSMTTSTGEKTVKANDGWFTLSSTGTGGDTNGAAADEFGQSIRKINMQEGCEVVLHVQGYDQFSFYGKDNSNSTSKCFEVYINDVKQSTTPDNTYSIRRFSLSGESLIRVKAVGGSNSVMVAFSLRLAQEPRTKWIKGNDSTQVIRQTEAPKPVYYFTKYNSLGKTELVWDGNIEATGIVLTPAGSSPLGDTLILGGQAKCPVGTYTYRVVSYFKGNETSSVSGSFSVKSEIKATTDTIISVRQGASMKEIKFNYWALSASDVHLTWTNSEPDGIRGSGSNGKYIISGSTNAAVGDYPFTVCVKDGNCINGLITVKSADLGPDPILFLCSKESNAQNDVIYKYLKEEKHKNLDAIEVNSLPREQEEYAPYKWIIISEDVDANNAELKAIVYDGIAGNKAVLNLQGFSYWEGRLNWGNTVNGSVDTTLMRYNSKLYVQRDDHPIFQGWKSGAIEILEPAKGKQGFMPIEITSKRLKQSLCLATAYTRDIEDYYANGELQLVMHEIPANMRGAKYICLSLAGNRTLSTDGKELIDRIVNYLTNEEPTTITAPKVEITQFSINGVDGVIDQISDTIKVTFVDQEVDLTALKANVTLADTKYTFVTSEKSCTNDDGSVDFSKSTFKPVDFVVSDYISRRAYHVVVMSKSSQAIEEVYEAGQWVNVFDIFGRKVATTNENIYTMDLPRGMYIIVTESGQTLKIMR